MKSKILEQKVRTPHKKYPFKGWEKRTQFKFTKFKIEQMVFIKRGRNKRSEVVPVPVRLRQYGSSEPVLVL
jgi:hypothetical protein